MKVTKIGLVVAAIGLLWTAGGSVQAQGAGVGTGVTTQHHGAKIGMFLKQLNLSPAQKKQIAGIAKAEKTEMQSIKQNTTMTPKAKKSQEKAVRKAGNDSIIAVLTPAQQAQLKQLIAQSQQTTVMPAPTPPTTPPASGTGN